MILVLLQLFSARYITTFSRYYFLSHRHYRLVSIYFLRFSRIYKARDICKKPPILKVDINYKLSLHDIFPVSMYVLLSKPSSSTTSNTKNQSLDNHTVYSFTYASKAPYTPTITITNTLLVHLYSCDFI